MAAEDPPYLTIKDICEELRVSPETVRKWLITGQLAHVRAGKMYRVRRSDLELMLAETTDATSPDTARNAMRPGAALDSGFE